MSVQEWSAVRSDLYLAFNIASMLFCMTAMDAKLCMRCQKVDRDLYLRKNW